MAKHMRRDFVAAIFDVGLKSASPKTILEMMTNTRDLTADHIKSHLQKYRLHRERARDEFLGNFGRPNHNLSRDTPVVEEGGVDSDLSRGILQRTMMGGGGPIAVDLRRGVSGNAVPDDTFRAQMSLIRECLQMQAGFQTVLKQALLSQQQLQQQLQAHLRALGLESSVAGEDGGGAAAAPQQQQPPPPASAGGRGMPRAAVVNATNNHHHHHQAPAVATRNGGPMPPSQWQQPQPAMDNGTVAHVHDGQPQQHHHHHHNHHRHHHHEPQQQAAPDPAQQQQQHHPVVTPNMQRRCAEQQMQEEMREHMDMHRQLVQRKNAQVSQYDDGSLIGVGSMHHPPSHQHLAPPSQQPPHPPHPPHAPPAALSSNMVAAGHSDLVDMDLTALQWNDDDDQLFNFLMDPA